jgi:hypothetical protein
MLGRRQQSEMRATRWQTIFMNANPYLAEPFVVAQVRESLSGKSTPVHRMGGTSIRATAG